MNDTPSFESNLWDCLKPEIEHFFTILKNKKPAITCCLQYPQEAYYSNFSGAGAFFLNSVGSTRQAREDGVSLCISFVLDDYMSIECDFSWSEVGWIIAEKNLVIDIDDLILDNLSKQVRIFLQESVDALLEAMS